MKRLHLLGIAYIAIIHPVNNGLAATGQDQQNEGDGKGVHFVCYGIPFDVLTRYPYGIREVESRWHYKIDVRDGEFKHYNEALSLIRRIAGGAERTCPGVDLRLVCEMVENGKNVAAFGLGADGDFVLIDGRVFDKCAETKQLFNIVNKYLPSLMSSTVRDGSAMSNAHR